MRGGRGKGIRVSSGSDLMGTHVTHKINLCFTEAKRKLRHFEFLSIIFSLSFIQNMYHKDGNILQIKIPKLTVI